MNDDTRLAYPSTASRSAALYERARRVLPSGNSRHTVFMRPYPVYAFQGRGCRITDVDGGERIDFINNYSALIHGHGHPAILAAVADQMSRLTGVGLPTESEILLAELLAGRLATVEQVRFTNSGTEAVMVALKAARAFTGRPKIAKVEGCYHGGYDYAEVSQNPAPADWGEAAGPASVANAAGAPAGMLADTLILPWNDVPAARALLRRHAGELAAVLIDPMPSRMAYVQIAPDYLAMIEAETRRAGALLVFDEVYNLRLGYGGAQDVYGAAPDLTTMGKIIGGGFPVGAVGGRAEVMAVFSLDGKTRLPHGGTYNANPISMTAGLAAMRLLTPAAFDTLGDLGERLREGLRRVTADAGVPAQVTGAGSFAAVVFTAEPFADYRQLVLAPKADILTLTHHGLMNRGVLTSPTLGFGACTAMGTDEIDFALEQLARVLAAL